MKKIPVSAGVRILILYAGFTLMISFGSWPYLWDDPLQKFIAAFGFMSDNPTQLPVLFNGQIYRADELPRRYLPILLGLTLSEPVWPLFILGGLIRVINPKRKQTLELALLSLWFFTPFAYVLLRRPPMYDGFRHFLFILPPVFVLCGIALEKIFAWIQPSWVKVSVFILIVVPSLPGLLQLHPYQYTYYNLIAGGTGGVFRRYETEYWLTCYKEAIEEFQRQNRGPAKIYVNREAHIAQVYANDQLTILERRGAVDEIKPGDLFLVNTRTNEDMKNFRDAPVIFKVGRAGAIFCEIKRIPQGW